MMVTLALLATFVADLPAAYGAPPPWEEAVREGNSAIQRKLVDPESARVEWPYTLIGGTLTLPGQQPQNGWYTCGFVNAKNRLGGYGGREVFLIMFQAGKPTIVEIGGRGGNGSADEMCADLAEKGALKSSGLESLGAMNPSALPPPTQAVDQAYQTVANASAQQPGGIGVSLTATPVGAVIMAVGSNSPAEKAGLKVGQIIESVEGINIKGMPLEALKAIMKNQPDRVALKVTGGGTVLVERNPK